MKSNELQVLMYHCTIIHAHISAHPVLHFSQQMPRVYSVSGIRNLKVNSLIHTYFHTHARVFHTVHSFTDRFFATGRFIDMHIMLGLTCITEFLYFVLQSLGVEHWQLELTLKEEDINITETNQFSKDVLVAHVYVLPTNLSDESISDLQNVI